MTHREAYAQIPDDAKWSSSFGYPGEGGFGEYFRTPDGRRFVIENGNFGDAWSVKEISQ